MFRPKTDAKTKNFTMKTKESLSAKLVLAGLPDDAVNALGLYQQTTPVNTISYAGFWRRAAADFVDAMILGVGQFPFTAPAGYILCAYLALPELVVPFLKQPAGIALCVAAALAFVSGIAFPWLYIACGESSRHQGTFGKRFLGLKVTNEHGENIGFWRSTWKVALVTIISLTPIWIAQLLMGINAMKLIPQGAGIALWITILEGIGVLIPCIFTLYMLGNERKQTIFDKLSKRLVVIHSNPNRKSVLVCLLCCTVLFAAEMAVGPFARAFIVKQQALYKEHNKVAAPSPVKATQKKTAESGLGTHKKHR
jgi:uncharacterized RDD family membrane protein YckC